MKIYLVGGAVRDGLLQRPISERDYVVVGATPAHMLAQGYTPVGKDFPVFLHPDTKQEYALARSERKNGHGYQGFAFFCAPDISLEQDLLRRDLTINAMALDEATGTLIDPYGGQRDLNQRILRHVSDAFVEDPLRVLRVARFAARYHADGFTIAPETLQLMQTISQSGELQHLSGERVWKETARALMEQHASVYFQVLRDCGALAVLFAEIDALFGVPQRAQYHPEIDCGIHTLMALDKACELGLNLNSRFAVLCHDLGKALTPKDELPRHIMHEQRGIAPVRALCQRLKVPKDCQDLAVKVCEHHLLCHQLFQLKASTIWRLMRKFDVLRKPQTMIDFAKSCQCDAQGRLGFEHKPYPQADTLIQLAEAVRQLEIYIPPQLQGAQIAEHLTQVRTHYIHEWMQPYREK